MNIEAPEKRPYRQSARALAAEATAERILGSFTQRLRDQWYDEIRLEDVANDSAVTIQTVIRRFGGKDGLLKAAGEELGKEVTARRTLPAADPASAIRVLIEDYEQSGDLVIRALAQEDRHPALKRVTDIGRASHRAWIESVFAPWLEHKTAAARQRCTDALVVASDVYVWKLVRRDMRRPVAEYQSILTRMLAAALEIDAKELEEGPPR